MQLNENHIIFTTNNAIYEYNLSNGILNEIDFTYELTNASNLTVTDQEYWFSDGEKLCNIIDKVDWNEFCIMQDIAFNFEVLLHGYATRKMGEFSMEHAYNSNASGGCSTYRTEDMRKDVVQRLLNKWGPLGIVKKMEDVKGPSASYWKWAEKDEKKTGKKPVGLHFNFQKAYKIGQTGNLEEFI